MTSKPAHRGKPPIEDSASTINPYDWYCFKRPKPTMRGVLHMSMFFLAPPYWTPMLNACQSADAWTSSILSLSAKTLLFLSSGLFHRGAWSFAQEKIAFRMDTTAISGMIAFSVAPGLVLLHESGWLLVKVCAFFAVSIASFTLIGASKKFLVLAFVAQGATVAVPLFFVSLLPFEKACLAACMAGYLLGACIIVREAPNPLPSFFGFHEIWHVLVVLSASATYAFNMSVLSRDPHLPTLTSML